MQKHYSCGGPLNATCAWCGQSFMAYNFHSAGPFSLAVPGSTRFNATGRSTGGRERAHEIYYESFTQLPAARRLSPWPTQRRICTQECLQKARAFERAMLEETETGGALSKCTIRINELRRTGAPSPSFSHTSPTNNDSYARRSLSPAPMLNLSSENSRTLSPTHNNTIQSCLPDNQEIDRTRGKWMGSLKVKIENAVNLLTHKVGTSAVVRTSDSFCVVVFGRQQRVSGLVKGALNPDYGDEFVFDVYEEDVPAGFLASPDRRERKKAAMDLDIDVEELKAEKKRRTALLRRTLGQSVSKKPKMITCGLDQKEGNLPWDQLHIPPGPDNCQIKIAIFHQKMGFSEHSAPDATMTSGSQASISGTVKSDSRAIETNYCKTDAEAMQPSGSDAEAMQPSGLSSRIGSNETKIQTEKSGVVSRTGSNEIQRQVEDIEPLGICSISALELVRDSKKKSRQVRGRLVHPDPEMVARGIVNIQMGFEGADNNPLKPPEAPIETWHRHESAGTHPRPTAAPSRASALPGKVSRAFKQIHLNEALPWKLVETESDLMVKVRAWDKVINFAVPVDFVRFLFQVEKKLAQQVSNRL